MSLRQRELRLSDLASDMSDVSNANGPKRSFKLIVNSAEPFNAEPPGSELTKSFVTPNELFFVRNHAPVPIVHPDSYRLNVSGLVNKTLTLSLTDLKNRFPKVTITASLMCAGNRRTELHKIQPVRGVGWGSSAISNAVWSGASLCAVLIAAGVHPESSGIHVAFEGLDNVKGSPYGGSVPIEKALDVNGGVLLAYEMNGEPLPQDHGYPVRVVVPGYVGARSVKWLASIVVQKEESSNFFQQKDYKLFPSHVTWDTVEPMWETTPALLELNVQAAITFPVDRTVMDSGLPCYIRGYAMAGGGRGISRVDISIDSGSTWETAALVQEKDCVRSVGTHWSWTLWRYKVESLPTPCVIICRAWDAAFNGMPSEREWNLRGVMNNSWSKVELLSSEQTSKL